MLRFVWRLEATALPALSLPCARCQRASHFLCTERFRVNANGGRLDVWLLYRCGACGEPHKRRVERRVRAKALPPELLAGYQEDAPALARACAFAAGGGAPVAHRVVREALAAERPGPGPGAACGFEARIVQPEPCGVRWDRLLARELACSRASSPARARSSRATPRAAPCA